ncbi:adenylate kinase [Bifidobacterium ramosum]|uniref:Adenylate kinase n=2 Tax=Bifidobacterium ramosum TaxID=1798158 RepID=A0A6L4WZB1_9BIFI|nr:adenylate kinase [Bifidobacterium ramosum]
MIDAMRIAIIGYSGSGKSTLARKLGERLAIPVMYLDQVHWLPGWKERDDDDARAVVATFMNDHESWVIEGNYTNLLYDERMTQADVIIVMLFGRFRCCARAVRRWLRYRGASRPDMTPGCPEKIDAEFAWWLLIKGRNAARRQRFVDTAYAHPDTAIIVRNPAQLAHVRTIIERSQK